MLPLPKTSGIWTGPASLLQAWHKTVCGYLFYRGIEGFDYKSDEGIAQMWPSLLTCDFIIPTLETMGWMTTSLFQYEG